MSFGPLKPNNVLPEIDCDQCGGAGFFGDNPFHAEACGTCNGTGVLVEQRPYRSAFASMRKDVGREIVSAIWERNERRGFGS